MSGYVKGNLRGADLLPCLHQVKWLEEESGAGAAEEEVRFSFTKQIVHNFFDQIGQDFGSVSVKLSATFILSDILAISLSGSSHTGT